MIAQKDGKVSSWDGGRFSDLDTLKEKLSSSSNLDIDDLRSNDDLRKSIIRLEIALDSKANSWVDDLSNAVYYHAKRKVSLKRGLESMIYVSRLMYASRNFNKAIGLTTAFQIHHEDFWEKYPEQLFIYFPEPYRNQYEKMADELDIPSSFLMAITRQESAFQAQVQSPAGAIGLMQIMPNTARGLLRRIGQQKRSSEVVETLKTPSWNIKLGATYLSNLQKRYNDDITRISAAYNAGEYVVDAWNKNRSSDDKVVWIESIPFKETRGYVKNSWRNYLVYKFLHKVEKHAKLSFKPGLILKM